MKGGTIKETLQTRKITYFPRFPSWVPLACPLLLFCLAAQAAGQSAPPPASRRVLHSISEIYALSVDQAKLGYPIDFEAVVTYSDAEWGTLFVQDGFGHTYIHMDARKTNYPLGSRVRVTGVTAFSGFAISIAKPKIQFLGAGPEVKPIPKTFEELNTGAYDSQLVVTEGVLHPCINPGDRACFRLLHGKMEFELDLRERHSTATDSLVGATVRASGVCTSKIDKDNKRIGSSITLESAKQIEVEMPPLVENSPPVTVQSLRPEDADLTMVRQVHMRGRVNWTSNRLFTLQDETGTIFVGTVAPVPVHLGDPVDVIGFPSHGRFGLELEDSSVQVTTGHPVGVKSAPLNTTVGSILKNSLNGQRVHLKARLESQEGDSSQIAFHFTDQDHPFSALLLLDENSRKIDAFPKGSTLELQGVEVLQNNGKNVPPSVLVLIESPDDLVLRPPDNWLTWRRALAILGFTALCLLVPLAWVKQLKRTVRKQIAINNEQMEKQLRLATKYQRLFERNLAALYSLRPDGVITECNDAFLKLLGLDDKQQLQNRSYWEFEIESERQEEMKNAQLIEMLSNCEATLRRGDGSIVYLLKNVSPVETPEGIAYETTAIDVTQMRRHQIELQRSRDTAVENSLIDPLTQLPNRRMLMESLPAIIENARQGRNSVALLYIDLDGFKPVNDSFGHAAGDDVLVHIANTMRSLVRKGDSLVRFGGDEFMLILSDLRTSEDAVRVAEGLLSAIDIPIFFLGQQVHVSASIGISIFPADAAQMEELIVRADMAMYAAKHLGGNQFIFYSDKIVQAAGEARKVAAQS
ncbi:MAG: sensor domain-containing diguanylate cyclase [Terracidiphilus sp.]